MASTVEYHYHMIRDACRQMEEVLTERVAELARLRPPQPHARLEPIQPFGKRRGPAQDPAAPCDHRGLAWEIQASMERIAGRAAQLSEILDRLLPPR